MALVGKDNFEKMWNFCKAHGLTTCSFIASILTLLFSSIFTNRGRTFKLKQLVGKDNFEKMWNFCKAHGLTDAGSAAVIGNGYAESGLNILR